MTQMTVDAKVSAMLHNVSQKVEIRDEAGRLLGYFIPVTEDRSLYERVKVPYTEEEIRELKLQPPGRPLADILADLEKRA